MPAKSLGQLCIEVCLKHVGMIYDVGDIPYHVVRPILLKVDNATQLRAIEANSPHLTADTAEHWQRLIAKHFPEAEQKNYVPRNPASWHKVYARYKKEHEKELAEAEAKLVNAFAALEDQKQSRTSRIVEQRLLPPPPRDGRPVGGSRRGAGSPDLPSRLSFGGGSRTKLTDGQSFMRRVRREAREDVNRRNLSTPSGQLPVAQGQIARAPEGMVREHRIKNQPAIPVRINAPRAIRPRDDAAASEAAERKQREARLLRIKHHPPNAGRPNFVSDSEEEDDDDNDNEQSSYGSDLFGDKSVPGPSASSTKKSSATPAAHAPTASARQNVPNASRANRNTGLLSNAYHSTSQARITQTGPQATQHGSSSPPLRAAQHGSISPPLRGSRPTNSGSASPALPSRSGPPLAPGPQLQRGQQDSLAPANRPGTTPKKRRSAVDIFMPKKASRK